MTPYSVSTNEDGEARLFYGQKCMTPTPVRKELLDLLCGWLNHAYAEGRDSAFGEVASDMNALLDAGGDPVETMKIVAAVEGRRQ